MDTKAMEAQIVSWYQGTEASRQAWEWIREIGPTDKHAYAKRAQMRLRSRASAYKNVLELMGYTWQELNPITAEARKEASEIFKKLVPDGAEILESYKIR